MSSNEELACKIQAGESALIPELWAGVVKFISWKANAAVAVASAAKLYTGVEADDLINSGFFAVLAAVKTYDSCKCGFLTWLDYYLRTAFAETMGYRTEAQKLAPIRHAVSLEIPLDDESGDTLGDLLEDHMARIPFEAVEDAIYREQLHTALDNAIALLPENQAEVLRRRFWENQTLEDIGVAIGVSTERIRQREDLALRAMREPPQRDMLERFIDQNTPFYLHVGPQAFRCTQTSATEKIILIRERMRKRQQRSANR